VFEQAGVPYGPRSELGYEASKEATRKRRDDAGTGLARKRMKVSGWKATTPKVSATPKSTCVASSKAAPSKVASSKASSSRPAPVKADATPKASVALKSGAPAKATVQKSMASLSMPKAGVLKIGARMKKPSVGPAPKGKQVRVNVAPSLAFAPIRQSIARPQALVEYDDS
jgi:hypothetical protein